MKAEAFLAFPVFCLYLYGHAVTFHKAGHKAEDGKEDNESPFLLQSIYQRFIQEFR